MKRMIKKAISLFMVVALVLSMAPMAFAASAPTIAVGTNSVNIEGLTAADTVSVTIPVTIANNPGFAGMDLEFNAPEGWEITDIKTDYTDTEWTVFCKTMSFGGITIPSPFTTPTVNAAEGSLVAAFNGRNGPEGTEDGLIHADGLLCWLTIAVPGGLVDGKYEVSVSAKWINNTNTAVDMTSQFTLTSGYIEVKGGISEDSLKPVINTQPKGATYTYAPTAPTVAPLTVEATAPTGYSLSYQWYKNDKAIDGANSASYTPDLPVVGDSDEYYCVVTTVYDGMEPSKTTETAVIKYVQATLGDVLTLENTEVTYTGADVNPGATVTGLTTGDYDMSGAIGKNVGEYKVIVTGKGNYTGSVSKDWEIVAADLKNVTVESTVSAVIGTKATLVASAETVDGSTVTYEYSIKSGDCITLSGNEVTATKEGTATVEVVMTAANHNKVTKTITVTVTNKNNVSGKLVLGTKTGPDSYDELNNTVLGDYIETLNYSSITSVGTVKVTYTLNGKAADLTTGITAAGEYTVVAKYEDDTQVGSVTHTFSVAKANQATLTIKDAAGTFGQDLTLEVTGGSTNGTVTYEVVEGDATISGNKLTAKAAGTVKVKATMAGNDNYNAVTSEAKEITFAKAAAPASIAGASVNVRYSVTGVKTATIVGVPENAGAVTYTVGAVTGNTGIVDAVSVNNSGVVSFTLTGTGAAGNSATIPVTVAMGNYESKTVNVVITLTDKLTPSLSVEGIEVVYTGEELTAADIVGTATVEGSAVKGTWSFVNYDASMVNVGTYTVTVKFVPENTVDYAEATTTISIKVTQAKPTGEPAYTPIKDAGKTLADAALGFGTLSEDGVIEWVDAEGNVLPDDTKVEPNVAYTWRYTPNSSNYSVITGSIVIYVSAPTYVEPFYKVHLPEDENLTITTTGSRAAEDSIVTLTIKADEGYTIESVEVADKRGNEITVKELGNDKYSFKMPGCEVYVTVNYVKDAEDKPVEPEFELPFIDVKEANWFYNAVCYVYKNGLMNGISEKLFAPDGTMTRAMMVTVLYRLEGEPAVTGTNEFTDVAAGKWYTNAVIWANENGIVNGYGNGLFGTNDDITREQLATIMYRYAQFKGFDVADLNDLTGYADAAEVSTWSMTGMQWANAAGLVNGRTETTLVPKGTANRAEVATILMRFIENVM